VDVLEAKGHGVKTQVVVKGGKGGSRIDIAPDPRATQSIAATLESKALDLNAYRDPKTGRLDLGRLRSAIHDDVRQVLKHQSALREGRVADAPFRERVVYTLENARPGESEQFQALMRSVGGKAVKGGVLQVGEGGLMTASGRTLPGANGFRGVAPEPPAPPGPPHGAGPAARTPSLPESRVPLSMKVPGFIGGVFHALNVLAALQEARALSRGEELNPNGSWGYGLGGKIIKDFADLPEGFSGHVISAPYGYGPGFYEKKAGVIYKDGKPTGAGRNLL
jgi:hypothetical protein